MKKYTLFHQPVSWAIFLLLAVGAVFYIYFNFDKANSLVNVEIEMNREEALQKAADIVFEYEIGPDSFKQVAAFLNDHLFQNFVELEGGGIDTFKHIISEGYYYSYYWTVRHFKEQEANEAVFWFKPNGEKYGFHEKIPESEKGAALSQDEALRIAEHHAVYNWDVDLAPFNLIEKSKEEQISGRIDHTFVYERTDKAIGDAHFRLKLVVSGDRLTTVEHKVKIPEDFDRRYSEMRSANNTIQMVSTAVIALFYGLLGVVFGIFILMRKRLLIWKPAAWWGIGIAFASVFLLTLNSLQFAWFSYDTSASQSNFLLRQILNGLMGALGFGSIIALSFMAAEGLGRIAFPGHIRWWKIWSPHAGGSIQVLGRTVAGYLFAVIILAFDVFFYVTTTTHFGWWSPAGTLSDPNILANYFPWLDSIAISLQAGFWEEALFRAVPIAGVFILTKGKKSRNIWIVVILIVQTLVFGAAHANYAQQPSYARVIEMIVPFTIMGIIYIRYGILPAVIAHYAVDVFWISLPLWVSSAPGIWIDRVFVLFFLFLPLFIVFALRLWNGKWNEVQEEQRNKGWLAPEVPEKEEESPDILLPSKKINAERWVLPIAAAGIGLWIWSTSFDTDSPVLELKKSHAVEIGETAIAEQFAVRPDEWTTLTTIKDQTDIRDIFVWQEGGEEIYAEMLGNFLAPPHWNIRLVKTEGGAEEKTEEYSARVLNNGNVLELIHKLPEKFPGANLSQENAQVIADSTLNTLFGKPRDRLKEVSVLPEKLDNRTDWKFIYADTLNFPMKKGQGRYLVEISGDEVTQAYSYVHVPEEWERDYKARQSKLSVYKTIGNVLVIGTIVLGLILGIIRWTRKKFNMKVFIWFTVLFLLIFILNVWLSRDSLLGNYPTQLPMRNYITSLLIGLAISGIFASLSKGVIIASTPGWLPVFGQQQKWNVLYAAGLGIFMAGIMGAVRLLLPGTEPGWMDYNYLNDTIPWLGLALSKASDIVFFPIFVAVLYLGIHYFTKKPAQKWIGILLALLAGLAIMALSFQSILLWIISGTIVALVLFVLYHYFFRFHFEWIPVSVGMLPILKMVKQMISVPDVTVWIGGILMILISSAILFSWYRLLTMYPVQTKQKSPMNEN